MQDRPIGDMAFNQYLKEEKLMGSRCNACTRLYAPPRALCVDCQVADMQWAEIVPSGKLAAFTCISVVTGKMREAGYGRNNPYCVGVVEMDEGPRVVGRITGVDAANPESIRIGMPVTAAFIHSAGDDSADTVLAFRPSGK